jgi:hypothetical protein
MCTSRIRRRGTDVHQQAKNKRDGCAQTGQRRRGTDMHQQAKNKRDGCAPAG